MIRVIVNADDFGLDENRTKAILQAYREGWISTTTAIVTTDWFPKSIKLVEKTRLHENIGLHLNLTEGFPLTDKIKNSPLFCASDGSFNAKFHNSPFHRLYLPSFEKEAVVEEIEAQLERYCKSGLNCFHLDSHHHIHTDLSIARIVLPLAAKAGFRTIRLSRNLGRGLNIFKRIYKKYINNKLASCSGISLNADYFSNFGIFYKNFKTLPDRCIIEVMTHPLYSSKQQLDMKGGLTDLHWNCSEQRDFWKNPSQGVQLVDYIGILD